MHIVLDINSSFLEATKKMADKKPAAAVEVMKWIKQREEKKMQL